MPPKVSPATGCFDPTSLETDAVEQQGRGEKGLLVRGITVCFPCAAHAASPCSLRFFLAAATAQTLCYRAVFRMFAGLAGLSGCASKTRRRLFPASRSSVRPKGPCGGLRGRAFSYERGIPARS